MVPKTAKSAPRKAVFVWRRLFYAMPAGRWLVVILAYMRYNAPHGHTVQPEENWLHSFILYPQPALSTFIDLACLDSALK